MNVLIKILNAIVKEHWPKILHVLLATLAGAVIFPITVVLTGLNGNDWTPIFIKVFIAIALLVPLGWPLRTAWEAGTIKAVSQYWYSTAPVMVVTAVILLLGILDTTRPLGIALGLIIDTVAVLIIGVYAFCQRFLYAALLEAPSSAHVDLADSEVNAKKVFRVVLAILAWEWFGAWYLVTFSPQLDATTGIVAILSLGIIVFTSYSMGFSGDTGQKILMYSAATVFTVLSLVLIDRAIENATVSRFLLGGYIGQTLKNPTGQGSIGLIGWITILIFLDLVGVTIAWIQQKIWISKLTFVMVMTLAIYLVGSWIATTGFSLRKAIDQITLVLNPSIQNLSNDIATGLLVAGLVGIVAAAATTIHSIKEGKLPAASLAMFSLSAFVVYELVFV